MEYLDTERFAHEESIDTLTNVDTEKVWMHLFENTLMVSGDENEARESYEHPDTEEYAGKHQFGYVDGSYFDYRNFSQNLIHFNEVESKKI